MQLRLDGSARSQYRIRSYDGRTLLINDRTYAAPVLLGTSSLRESALPERIEALAAPLLDELLAQHPELILLGAGARYRRLPPVLMAQVQAAGVGIEVMSTAAACRTFNVLAGEGRRVLALLLPD